VLLDDPDDFGREWMEFRLTYTGPLLASQPADAFAVKDRRKDNKHYIRRQIHHQLKRLWDITPFLARGDSGGPTIMVHEPFEASTRTAEHFANKYAMYGFNFVPLVVNSYDLLCGLDILFLRPDPPGAVIKSGDIDNRLKTLFDALSVPDANEDYVSRTLADDEKPFFVLLEDDNLITKISVETDQLLDFPQSSDPHKVSLVITVRVRPHDPHIGNLQFSG
jgi:hypothetical protein